MSDQKLRLEWLDPKTLTPNPMNWRRHPEKQKKILDAVLTEVGWAGVALFNETTGRLIDGHARRDWAIAKKLKTMPVLVGSWSEADEKKILVTMDPIAAMAEQADDLYRELLEGMETGNQDLSTWCDDLTASLGIREPPFGDDFLPDHAGAPDVSGDDTRTGRFILVFRNEAEKQRIMKHIGVSGGKVIYTVEDLNV